jgi:hypothetical protein
MSDPKPRKNPEEIRRKVMEDPTTAEIAEALEMPLEKYVEGVVRFAMNPAALPEYQSMSNQEIQNRFGITPMTNEQILKLFDSEVEQATIMEKTDYTAPKAKPIAMPELETSKAEADPRLKAELDKKLSGNKGEKA